MDALSNELQLFDKIRQQLCNDYPNGGFVLIKGSEIGGVFNTRQEATKEGLMKYGDVDFLVKNIEEDPGQIHYAGWSVILNS